jgi:energy-coupling factor transporter ATP-binding protein EcfA2
MRLRRVVVTGFKTFASRSELLLEPGVTAIVGPNGSGKSNLVDAIRWALGETNARELRGARMDEVIYSGGNARPRMGFAEVELVIDNEDGGLAVDDAEVSVSRRVVRHGDSDFRLNGGRVRLRDLERLLGSTGLTQSGYAVVAQNDIDAIIEATPLQRRALVEQAAGVRSLRAACEDALARVGHRATPAHRAAQPPARLAGAGVVASRACSAPPGPATPRRRRAPARGGNCRRGGVRHPRPGSSSPARGPARGPQRGRKPAGAGTADGRARCRR